MNVAYRAPTSSDVSFIMSVWLDGQRHEGERAYMTNRVYFSGEKKRLEKLLSRANVAVICNPSDQDQIYGFLAYEHQPKVDLFIIHYAHLKRAYRRLGLVSALVTALYPRAGKDEIAITHINKLAAGLRTKLKLKYNPYLKEML